LNKSLHQAIKKVTEDLEAMSFNTAISAMMILVNDLYKEKSHSRNALLPLLKLLSPFAPHLSQELWSISGEQGLICEESWPSFDESLCKEDQIEMGVQVNGKMRGTISVTEETTEEAALAKAVGVSNIASHTEGKKIIKVIYKAGKILNIIVK
jgi:leucyl-tRNA synthetase